MPRRPSITDLALLLSLIGLLVLPRLAAPAGSTFEGTDSIAVALLEQSGVSPGFQPLLPAWDGRQEAALFAAQGALGAALLVIALVGLHRRHAVRTTTVSTTTPGPTDGGTTGDDHPC